MINTLFQNQRTSSSQLRVTVFVTVGCRIIVTCYFRYLRIMNKTSHDVLRRLVLHHLCYYSGMNSFLEKRFLFANQLSYHVS
jgi:hypothetical protein